MFDFAAAIRFGAAYRRLLRAILVYAVADMMMRVEGKIYGVTLFAKITPICVSAHAQRLSALREGALMLFYVLARQD